jgi:hypothetical protein
MTLVGRDWYCTVLHWLRALTADAAGTDRLDSVPVASTSSGSSFGSVTTSEAS